MVGSRFERFLTLHEQATPLVMVNPWDIGSAKIFEALGFEALATTSSGFAGTLGRLDGSVTRDEVLAHAHALVTAVSVPVSADLEKGYAPEPAGVAETVALAAQTGLAGCSIEDYARDGDTIYPFEVAVDRVLAAAETAHRGSSQLVLTGRCENYLHGHPDLADTISQLQGYQDAGADVLFAPGVNSEDDLRVLVASVDRPVNVLPRPGMPTVDELGALGVRRISVGGSLCWTAIDAAVRAATELRDHGTYSYWSAVPDGLAAAKAAFTR